jgi:hypothetical protein
MFKPITLDQVLEITERSQRTINRWIQTGRLTAYEEKHRRQIVFNEDDVVELEHETTVARRQGRPRPSKRPGGAVAHGVDAGH